MLTAAEIEIAVANHFGYRQNIIVPNVSWGLFNNMEVDLLVLRPSGYCMEVEIKTTASDIRADLKKRHQHKSKLLRQTWFAVPFQLSRHPDIPTYAGVLSVAEDDEGNPRHVSTVRACAVNREARKLTPTEIEKVGRLAAMRIWTLKQTLAFWRHQNIRLPDVEHQRDKAMEDYERAMHRVAQWQAGWEISRTNTENAP